MAQVSRSWRCTDCNTSLDEIIKDANLSSIAENTENNDVDVSQFVLRYIKSEKEDAPKIEENSNSWRKILWDLVIVAVVFVIVCLLWRRMA